MNWDEAVKHMERGHHMRRRSEVPEQIGEVNGMPVCASGTEPIMLLAAWTHDDRPVLVFIGAWSRAPFVPQSEDLVARDWERV